MEHSLASVIDCRSTSDSVPYFAVATVATVHKDFANIISNDDFTILVIWKWTAIITKTLVEYK